MKLMKRKADTFPHLVESVAADAVFLQPDAQTVIYQRLLPGLHPGCALVGFVVGDAV